MTHTLSFSNLIPDPVAILFEDGAPNAAAEIIKMRELPLRIFNGLAKPMRGSDDGNAYQYGKALSDKSYP